MPTKIPPPIAAYFTSGNKHDIQGMIASFTKDAIVKDESEERRGLDAVREWIEETTRKYRHTVAILDASEANGATTVTAHVSGSFPGSPVDLDYVFTLDEGKIARLGIS